MNERIRSLAEQAGADIWGDEVATSRYFDLEKFVELIVKECAQRCEEVAFKHQVEETTYAAGMKAGAFECATDLKQHFGVEE